ncbi:HalOD1 output domain-containing protein [Haladaptatus pallidirubidus]|uniref:Halobacterial output domain-containing protein n=1 Tax=Haladaptatus pallidirubidus TaxID=1008152 RepID=A0AAV3UDH6_9EURY|nr:HalOD1 output domain-containing protein [Haladaptatus pallidirubidus]
MSGVNAGLDGSDAKPTPVANETGFHVYHDATTDWELSETLLSAIAIIRNTDPTKSPIPLTDSVDPDALDALFADTYDGRERNRGHVVFTISGFEVFAHANGHVFLRERTGIDEFDRR